MKPYESKQCRYEIEMTGLLPDEPAIRLKEETSHGGITGTARVRVHDESMALIAI